MQNTLEKADASVEEVSFISEEEHLEGAETKVSGANAMGTWFLGDAFFAAIEKKKQAETSIDEYLRAKITEYGVALDIESDFWYFLTHFFDMWSAEDIDEDYVLRVGAGIARYEKELIEKVNNYAKSFKYEQMDLLDQACLLLWYLEVKIIGTPKELVINEMVELATRYSDEGSPKLVNGILHPLLTAESEK